MDNTAPKLAYITLREAAALLLSGIEVEGNSRIGWLDGDQTLRQVLVKMEKRVLLPLDCIESLIFAAKEVPDFSKYEKIAGKSKNILITHIANRNNLVYDNYTSSFERNYEKPAWKKNR